MANNLSLRIETSNARVLVKEAVDRIESLARRYGDEFPEFGGALTHLRAADQEMGRAGEAVLRDQSQVAAVLPSIAKVPTGDPLAGEVLR